MEVGYSVEPSESYISSDPFLLLLLKHRRKLFIVWLFSFYICFLDIVYCDKSRKMVTGSHKSTLGLTAIITHIKISCCTFGLKRLSVSFLKLQCFIWQILERRYKIVLMNTVYCLDPKLFKDEDVSPNLQLSRGIIFPTKNSYRFPVSVDICFIAQIREMDGKKVYWYQMNKRIAFISEQRWYT